MEVIYEIKVESVNPYQFVPNTDNAVLRKYQTFPAIFRIVKNREKYNVDFLFLEMVFYCIRNTTFINCMRYINIAMKLAVKGDFLVADCMCKNTVRYPRKQCDRCYRDIYMSYFNIRSIGLYKSTHVGLAMGFT